uniref:Uncharacterized protein n=1 Tax=Arundo donax TaxID=35708 RepID=A0A0A9DGI8_ARUDO
MLWGLISKCTMRVLHPQWRYLSPLAIPIAMSNNFSQVSIYSLLDLLLSAYLSSEPLGMYS